MITTKCTSCGKFYSLDDVHEGKRVRCPQCATVFEAKASRVVGLRARLKRELSALASASPDPDHDPAEGPVLRIAEHGAGRMSGRRAVLLALLVVLVAGGGGAGLWYYLAWRQPKPVDVPQAVTTAIAKAERDDAGGDAARALLAWRTVRRVILAQPRQHGALQSELSRVEDRIRELSLTLRRADVGPAPPVEVLAQALMALDAGRNDEAKAKAEQVLAILAKSPAGANAASIRDRAQKLLADSRLSAKPKPQGRSVPQPGPKAKPPAPRRAAAPPVPPQQRLKQLVDAVLQSTRRGDPIVLIDAPEGLQRWYGESWADPVKVAIEKRPGAKDDFVLLRQQDGSHGKWVVSIDQPMDLSAYDLISFEMQVREPIMVSLAVWTDPGGAIFETRPITVADGETRNVSFPLKGNQFKSSINNWQFGTAIKNRSAASKITIFIYKRTRNPIRFRNLRLEKAA